MGINQMEKKKSLGSTPIGYSTNTETYSFIRDINDHHRKTEPHHEKSGGDDNIKALSKVENKESQASAKSPAKKEKSVEKKVVSYYLEKKLVKRMKMIAEENGDYYSSVVSNALRNWLNIIEN